MPCPYPKDFSGGPLEINFDDMSSAAPNWVETQSEPFDFAQDRPSSGRTVKYLILLIRQSVRAEVSKESMNDFHRV